MTTYRLERTVAMTNLFAGITYPRAAIHSLPEELIPKILRFLPFSTLRPYSLVCFQFSEHVVKILSSESYLREHLSRDIDALGLPLEGANLVQQVTLIRNIVNNKWQRCVFAPLDTIQFSFQRAGNLFYLSKNNRAPAEAWLAPKFEKKSIPTTEVHGCRRFEENGTLFFSKISTALKSKVFIKPVSQQKEHTFVRINTAEKKLDFVHYDFFSREQKITPISVSQPLLDFFSEEGLPTFSTINNGLLLVTASAAFYYIDHSGKFYNSSWVVPKAPWIYLIPKKESYSLLQTKYLNSLLLCNFSMRDHPPTETLLEGPTFIVTIQIPLLRRVT